MTETCSRCGKPYVDVRATLLHETFEGHRPTRAITTAKDVTQEVIDMAEAVTDGWYPDGPIDWEDVWDRMDGWTFDDGWGIDFGTEVDTPAMRKIQRVIRNMRKSG